MAFKADKEMMELIWQSLPKAPDEDHVTYAEVDIRELWHLGFVDTETYPEEEWVQTFEPHKVAEETYVLSKQEFLEKDKYRYKGEIKIPFEPLLINEGKYTDEGLQELIDQSIDPSCFKCKKELHEFFEDFKDRYRDTSDDLIVMDINGKREIKELIENNPSPLRVLELIFDAMFIQEIASMTGGTPAAAVSATPEQAIAVQASTFSKLPSSGTEEAAQKLKGLEKSEKPKATGSSDEGVELKKVKRSRKGFKG